MTTLVLENLAFRFDLSLSIVRSWTEAMDFANEKVAVAFFEENIDYIKAQPFVKWVGGKRQLLSQFAELFPKKFENYFEPFLGGGAVFFNLQKKKSYLSDINVELINAYQVVKNYPEELIQLLKTFEYSKEFYTEIRAWDRELDWQSDHTAIQRAARFIFLNRTCFNGLHRVNSRGEFNVPM